jgi:hypothetical protein
MSASVIVEPDSASAWIGLAGVALGALLSTGATWLQRRSSALKHEHTDIREAIVEMLTGAEALDKAVSVPNSSKGSGGSLLLWVQFVTSQTEKVEKAALKVGISRYATAELTASAGKVAATTILCARLEGADGSLEKLREAVKELRPEVAKAGTTMSKLRYNLRSGKPSRVPVCRSRSPKSCALRDRMESQ